VLSELADEWATLVPAWSRMLRARHAGMTEAIPPAAPDEYAFYQLLLAAWPVELIDALQAGVLEPLSERLQSVMLKSVREAKLHTTWAMANASYEDPVLDFVRYALDGSRANAFLESFAPFAARVAELGLRNSLLQTVLKLTVPGVPDIYQGAELWDLNLVDPDNRRPVDFKLREILLSEGAEDSWDWRSGSVKLSVISKLLELRRLHPDLFAEGFYEPLTIREPDNDRGIAFLRVRDGVTMIVAGVRFPARSVESEHMVLDAPEEVGDRPLSDALSGEVCKRTREGRLLVRLSSRCPGAVLLTQPTA
jgi:(1->4)-alpha-D-glucan 1-alpha-D-glucosylmutase